MQTHKPLNISFTNLPVKPPHRMNYYHTQHHSYNTHTQFSPKFVARQKQSRHAPKRTRPPAQRVNLPLEVFLTPGINKSMLLAGEAGEAEWKLESRRISRQGDPRGERILTDRGRRRHTQTEKQIERERERQRGLGCPFYRVATIASVGLRDSGKSRGKIGNCR